MADYPRKAQTPRRGVFERLEARCVFSAAPFQGDLIGSADDSVAEDADRAVEECRQADGNEENCENHSIATVSEAIFAAPPLPDPVSPLPHENGPVADETLLLLAASRPPSPPPFWLPPYRPPTFTPFLERESPHLPEDPEDEVFSSSASPSEHIGLSADGERTSQKPDHAEDEKPVARTALRIDHRSYYPEEEHRRQKPMVHAENEEPPASAKETSGDPSPQTTSDADE